MRLVLGTAQFGLEYGIANPFGRPTLSAVREILDCARRCAVGMLDTAIAYGDSETRLGKLGTSGFDVVTKLPSVPPGCDDVSAWVRDMIEGSLRRLGAAELYGLLLHRPADLLATGGTALADALLEAKSSGRVRKIGVSIYEPDDLFAIARVCPLDLVQAPFNLLDRRLVTSSWLERLRLQGTEIHARSIFLQGLLLMPRHNIPTKFAPWSGIFDRWTDWLADIDASPLEACIGYAMSYPGIDRVVVGVDNPEQLAYIMRAVSQPRCLPWPDIGCEDERLINPGMWSLL